MRSFLRVMMMLIELSFIDSTTKSTCSRDLIVYNIDHRTQHEYVSPCPVSVPCQCLCEVESKHLWIDCFHRKLKHLPTLGESSLRWNIDLAFNLFESLTDSESNLWMLNKMHIDRLIFSNSLAYDLIVQLNLTHRHLFDRWTTIEHLVNMNDDEYHYVQNRRLLNDLTNELQEQSQPIRTFNISLASRASSSISILYLDHQSLNEVPSDAFYNATEMTELYLSFNEIANLSAFAFGFSHRLTRLDLSHNLIETIDNSTFDRHPDAFAGPFLIDHLDLSYNRLTHLNENLFSYLVNLRILKLQHNAIFHLSSFSWTGLYRLKYLDLSHNAISNFSQAFYSSYLNELNYLKISSNNIEQTGSCEFLSMKSLKQLDLSNNKIKDLDSCAFYGFEQAKCHVHLRSNRLKSINPCTFNSFARSTIHLENNPLICNCSFNYLVQDRQSIAYTGHECGGGYSYEPQTQFLQAAVRKSSGGRGKKFLNNSKTCRNAFRHHKQSCAKLDCFSLCSPNERLVIQITTIATPSRSKTIFTQNFFSLICLVSFLYSL